MNIYLFWISWSSSPFWKRTFNWQLTLESESAKFLKKLNINYWFLKLQNLKTWLIIEEKVAIAINVETKLLNNNNLIIYVLLIVIT